jgi:hypothetical protein
LLIQGPLRAFSSFWFDKLFFKSKKLLSRVVKAQMCWWCLFTLDCVISSSWWLKLPFYYVVGCAIMSFSDDATRVGEKGVVCH